MWCVCVPTIMICKSGLLLIRGGLWVAVGMYRRETLCDILKKEIVYFIKRERERERERERCPLCVSVRE